MNPTIDIRLKNSFFVLFVFTFSYFLLIPFGFEHSFFLIFANLIYLVALPTLVFLFGTQAQMQKEQGFIHSAFLRFFIPYLVFQFIYSLGLSGTASWFVPLYGLWLVLSLFLWNLFVPLFKEIKYPITTAFFIGVTFPMINTIGEPFSLLRMFSFLPFFILGYFVNEPFIEWIQSLKRKVYVASATVFLVFTVLLIPGETLAFLAHGAWNYNVLQLPYIQGVLLKGLVYLLMVSGVFLFIFLIPRKKIPFTGDRYSFIPIYLLGLGALFLLRESGWNENFSFWKILLIPFLSLLVYAVANSPWLRRISAPLTQGTVFLVFEAVVIVLRNLLKPIFFKIFKRN